MVSEAEDDVQAAIVAAERLPPEVAIIDAAPSNGEGARVARQIRDRFPACGILLIVTNPDLPTMVDALEAGVRAFITKETSLSALVEATRKLANGEPVIPPQMLEPLLAHLMQRHSNQEEARRRVARLTRREREVLALIVDGADNDSIARNLVISRETARTHVQNVLRKLDVHSRLEAAAFVMHNGVSADLARAGH